MASTLCYLLLTEAFLPTAEAVVSAFAECWPELPPLAAPRAADNALVLPLASGQAGISLIPLPRSGLALRADSSMWPTAGDDLSEQGAHLVVSLDGPAPEVERALLLTQLCVALLSCTPALGVYWPAADLAIESDTFIEVAQGCEGDFPLALWVDFLVAEAPTGSTGSTRGLRALGQPEVEAPASPEPPEELYDRLYGVAAYLLSQGSPVGDGDTLGETEDEYVRARVIANSEGSASIQLVYED